MIDGGGEYTRRQGDQGEGGDKERSGRNGRHVLSSVLPLTLTPCLFTANYDLADRFFDGKFVDSSDSVAAESVPARAQ